MTEQRLKGYKDIKAELAQLERLRAVLLQEAQRDAARGWIPRNQRPKSFNDLVNLYARKIRKARAELQTIEKAIDAVPDDLARRLLQLRYLEGLTWEEVADAISYSPRHIYAIRDKALAMI